MDYQIIIDEGVVIRVADGKTVSPCQSLDDADFVAYGAWVEAGNAPQEIQTRSA